VPDKYMDKLRSVASVHGMSPMEYMDSMRRFADRVRMQIDAPIATYEDHSCLN
jgi:hypothetical protein